MRTLIVTLSVGLSAVALSGCGSDAAMPEADRQEIVEQEAQKALTESPEQKVLRINMLGKQGKAAQASLPTLEKLQSDPHPKVQQAAKEAIASIRADGG